VELLQPTLAVYIELLKPTVGPLQPNLTVYVKLLKLTLTVDLLYPFPKELWWELYPAQASPLPPIYFLAAAASGSLFREEEPPS
jgi:hypothetical protein